MKQKHHININGIRLYGYHGCLEEEAKIGGHYIVDVCIGTDFYAAAISDDLTKTIDYCAIYEISKKEMGIRSRLIEQVCKRIFDSIRNEFRTLLSLRVRVTKIAPPMNGDVQEVSVEIAEDFE